MICTAEHLLDCSLCGVGLHIHTVYIENATAHTRVALENHFTGGTLLLCKNWGLWIRFVSDFLPWSFDHIIQSAGFESLGYPWDKLAQIFKLQNLAIPVQKPVEKVGYLELSIWSMWAEQGVIAGISLSRPCHLVIQLLNKISATFKNILCSLSKASRIVGTGTRVSFWTVLFLRYYVSWIIFFCVNVERSFARCTVIS